MVDTYPWRVPSDTVFQLAPPSTDRFSVVAVPTRIVRPPGATAMDIGFASGQFVAVIVFPKSVLRNTPAVDTAYTLEGANGSTARMFAPAPVGNVTARSTPAAA